MSSTGRSACRPEAPASRQGDGIRTQWFGNERNRETAFRFTGDIQRRGGTAVTERKGTGALRKRLKNALRLVTHRFPGGWPLID